MRPPGKSTLDRMRAAAADEATRIEITQDAMVAAGTIKEPSAAAIARRDDFAGVVRLIDLITSDAILLERLSK